MTDLDRLEAAAKDVLDRIDANAHSSDRQMVEITLEAWRQFVRPTIDAPRLAMIEELRRLRAALAHMVQLVEAGGELWDTQGFYANQIENALQEARAALTPEEKP
jgi:hypothetical protein